MSKVLSDDVYWDHIIEVINNTLEESDTRFETFVSVNNTMSVMRKPKGKNVSYYANHELPNELEDDVEYLTRNLSLRDKIIKETNDYIFSICSLFE